MNLRHFSLKLLAFTGALLALAASSARASYATTILADTPTVWHRLNESSGTATADSSGNGYTGGYFGSFTLSQTGATVDGDTAVLFDGSSGFVQNTAVDTVANPGTGDFSVEAWVKVSGAPGVAYVIVAKYAGVGDTHNYWIGVWSSGKAVFSVTNADNPAGVTIFGGVTITDGAWHHVVGVKDAGTLRLYIDGAADGTASWTTGHTIAPTGHFKIARFSDDGSAAFLLPGTVDEVAYYPAALSAVRVAAHYTAGTSGGSPTMAVAPSTVYPRTTGTVLTLTGSSTTWSGGSTVFTVSGAGATKTAQSVSSGTSATVTIDTTTSTGTVTITETVTGSTSNTTTVLAYKRIDVTTGGVALMILEPAAYDATLAHQLIFYHHGYNEDSAALLTDSLKSACVARFISDGYVMAGISAGNNWGNSTALAAYVTAYSYLGTNYKLRGTLIWSQSMGGCAGLLNFAARAYTDARGWLGTYPVCNLANMYASPTFTSSIETAYNIPGGGNYATQTAGHDPVLLSAATFNGRYMYFYSSPDDTVVTAADNTDQMVTLVTGYAQTVTNTVTTGNHGSPGHFVPSAYSAQAAQALRAPAVLSGMN